MTASNGEDQPIHLLADPKAVAAAFQTTRNGLVEFARDEPIQVGDEVEAVPLGAVGRYRKKPVEIDAMPVTVDAAGWPSAAAAKWCGGRALYDERGSRIEIETLEGVMRAELGDWIIRGVQGEFYPCKPDIFEATYEPVSNGGVSIKRVGGEPEPLDEFADPYAICAVGSNSGRNGEPLACGYPKGHDGPHAWASLPTFVDGQPALNGSDAPGGEPLVPPCGFKKHDPWCRCSVNLVGSDAPVSGTGDEK